MFDYLLYLESLLNRCIQWDPQLPIQLKQVEGKAIRLFVLPVSEPLLIQIENQQIQLSSIGSDCALADLTIKATPFSLLRFATSDQSELHDITIEGDAGLAQTLQTIARSMDIDWEHQLSRFTGNIIANRVGNAARRFHQVMKRGQKRLKENMTEYLQEETQWLPSVPEIEQWYAEVDRLRDDVERLTVYLQQKEH